MEIIKNERETIKKSKFAFYAGSFYNVSVSVYKDDSGNYILKAEAPNGGKITNTNIIKLTSEEWQDLPQDACNDWVLFQACVRLCGLNW